MTKQEDNLGLSLFEQKQLRRVWHKGEWYYSIIDVIAVLTDSTEPRKYWTAFKARVKTEGFDETLVQIEPLKLKSPDGRLRLTDTANRQTLLRILQSIPSPKAEPFRLWLAQVGEERFEEIENPEAALDRVRATYRAKGYDDSWIEERIPGRCTPTRMCHYPPVILLTPTPSLTSKSQQQCSHHDLLSSLR